MPSASGRAALAAAAAALLACGGGSKTSSPPVVEVAAPADNVLRVTVDGALCASGSYPNKPCVQIKICAPGTTTCQTISDVLVDTGSFGVRLFKSALDATLASALPPVMTGGRTVATCVQYGDGSADWGPLATADVVLGNEPAVQVPIQVIDAAFPTAPASCPNPDPTPSAAGFNGILGVGVFPEDCGPGCQVAANNGVYFACDGTSCSGVALPLAQQIQNPAARLAGDGNGVIIELPSIPRGGAPSLDGALVLGIGTRDNNGAAGVTPYLLDGNGDLTTSLSGATTSGFLDTGSNGLFFAPPSGAPIPPCPSPDAQWFCPASPVQLSATNVGTSGPSGPAIPFEIDNFQSLVRTPNNVFAEIGGGSLPTAGFDWGLPFHLGRKVFVGFEGRRSALGTGPYVAY